ncbi:dTDP-4-dehydrorhamnose 3,5-epimerase family protein [Coxiella-like endosymbiont]|uniref:dTDP-4-dehydrorhamnose 3,5-epimerase family protein n=1 Tax=Coxiella-like endosymbiont TaxID=1592897 RepID=UPI0034E1F69D
MNTDFLKSFHQKKFDDVLLNGKPLNFIQDNHTKSAQNILRGLHYHLCIICKEN